jgi:hypothetical protein
MKNIHVLQKNIFNQLGVDHYGKTPTQIKIAEFLINKNIYITSSEEIKEGDWFINESNQIEKGIEYYDYKVLSPESKKIILTTDQDLINDGVQAIDDDFLEWFVKNRSCERVEVVNDEYVDLEKDEYVDLYKIIIPQEEPNQETLEEAAERNYKEAGVNAYFNNGFIRGAKWQAERMYSEEEVEQIFNIGQMIKNYGDYKPYTFKEALEQFKKK